MPVLDSGKGGVPLSSTAAMDQHLSSQRCAASICDTGKRHVFLFCHCFYSVAPVPLSLSPCTSLPDTHLNTHTHTISKGYRTSCCLQKKVISSYQQQQTDMGSSGRRVDREHVLKTIQKRGEICGHDTLRKCKRVIFQQLRRAIFAGRLRLSLTNKCDS